METKEYIKQKHVMELLQAIGTEPKSLTELGKQYTKSLTTAHSVLQRLVAEGVVKRMIDHNHHPTYVITDSTTAYLADHAAAYRSPHDIDEFMKEPSIVSIIKLVMDEPKQLFQIEKHSTRSHSNVFETMQKLVEYGYVRKLKNGHKKEYVATDKAVLLLKNLAEDNHIEKASMPLYHHMEVPPPIKDEVDFEATEALQDNSVQTQVVDEDRSIETTIRHILLIQDLLDELREAVEKHQDIDLQSYISVITHQIEVIRQ